VRLAVITVAVFSASSIDSIALRSRHSARCRLDLLSRDALISKSLTDIEKAAAGEELQPNKI
jgi:hypothetical protein